MFERMRRWWRDIKINADFPRYEAEERRLHEAAASKRFSTESLRAELDGLTQPHLQRCEKVFGEPIRTVEQALIRIEKTISESRQQIDLLQIDYRAALQPLYERSREIRCEWDELLAQKRAAHQDRESAQQSIESWHNKSSRTGFFGNGGKALPKHAMFGQSFGDLDGYKADRQRAIDEIRRSSSGLDDLSQERDFLQSQIDELKAGQSRQRQLFEQGLRLPTARDQLQRTSERHAEQTEVLRRLEAARRRMMDQGWHRSGAQSVQDAIDAAEHARAAYVRTFDAEGASERRRLQHRERFGE